MINAYPVYIVSKGRAEHCHTARALQRDGVPFQVLVEPQEYALYCQTLGVNNVIALPFANLGLGSFPARNYAWDLAKQGKHAKHWVFDDNIRGFHRVYKGLRVPCNALKAIYWAESFADRYANLGICAFNYRYFVRKGSSDRKPFVINQHCYSGMLIDTSLPFRWRMKYNEDVDLCLQVLHSKLCTVLLNAFTIDKISTVAKMKGGNQDELYKGNAYGKKVLKARSLEQVWPQYATTVMRFNRPHHCVDWRKHFKQPLLRRQDIDWHNIESSTVHWSPIAVGNVQSQTLKNLIKQPRNSHETQTT